MNHLIIYAHPNPQSFNRAILQQAVQASSDHQVIVRDLCSLNIHPNLAWQEFQDSLTGKYAAQIQTEHQYWQQADVITFIYPLWWMGFPAILKGYLDRVLTYGFAYTNGETESVGLLKGKKMQQFVTMGNSNQKYAGKGFLKSLDDTLGNGLFSFCGIENVKMHYLGDVGLKETDYAALLQQIEQSCREILK
ncbi:NAD(P)H-dependent oxidoreductase [Actinobacillus pleuropneumoniae]|uniref:Putative NAD(P)H oxidoreductase n=1 Tax=Actinobacillus pleuropneumoniae TaxID=715 RepID=A0A3S4ZWA5_ACTPL|nr:NAD(P)H-dependent oxidoreductase [Actinobacillus pleuropneumoniae]EFL77567.1 putative NAD(P)H oxidoreductase [Actinobacillus pleuropneumoniae serovar 2 str. 4226]EFM87233.1 NAD(P)H dehydrogenase (Quinone) [Actinobacillus pleuropneumoniae serovar 2 str. S1536]MEE3619563.1 NAD(P)H-dependent oxidoreductase [Actinobacillus pleuropneumoniae]UKH08060.1 NAD(P)H-dependent oxidoreductase [Actinobacillus pleuropneumoniae]UKH46163.1 flavodoxin family protein [Actinobacillus pleuropneumoniae serovar 2 